MKVEIKVPSMGESISEATIGSLIKSTGSQVVVDDELLELETDKVNQVIYAQQAGTLTWKVAKDDVVAIGQVIGYIDTAAAPEKMAKEKKTETVVKEKKPESSTSAPTPALAPSPAPAPIPQPPTSPATSKLKPSSEGIRLSKEQYIAELGKSSSVTNAASLQSTITSTAEPRETRKKMSKIRKLIANRLVDVMQETAMLTTFNEVDMTAIMNLRDNYKESFVKQHNTRLGFMSFFIKAVVSALKAFPDVNAYIDGDDVVYRNYFDIGVAVGTERGLIVPVVRQCDKLSFAGIEKSIEGYAKKAREGGLSADDLIGGGFTITNGGVYGSLLSTPILNPPQCAILGMHKIMKRAVVINDEIVIRQMMYLALSYDHRIIDGKEAVSFLVHIKQQLEDPSRLLLEV